MDTTVLMDGDNKQHSGWSQESGGRNGGGRDVSRLNFCQPAKPRLG